MSRFIVDGRYEDILKLYGITVEEVLRKAELPLDVFRHKNPTMTEKQYFSFMETIGLFINDPEVPIKMASADRIETFSPPIFAAYCSKNGYTCVHRLSRYKCLISPMRLIISENENSLTVEYKTISNKEIPLFLAETEIVFLLNILRKATKENITPILVEMINTPKGTAFTEYLGVKVKKADKNAVTFGKTDLQKSFISFDESMWNYFEPELNKRLSEIDIDESTSGRVRSALTELLPSGESGIDDVAEKLGLSKRTLQRKLNEENTTFQKQLNSTRESLAIHYIRNTDMTTNDIAFLLGYQEINSFLRAFTIWTGMSISEYKNSIKK